MKLKFFVISLFVVFSVAVSPSNAQGYAPNLAERAPTNYPPQQGGQVYMPPRQDDGYSIPQGQDFAPPDELEVVAPLPRPWRPSYRLCPPGSFFVPSQWYWNGLQWIWVRRDVCETRPGFIYITPHYVPRGRRMVYRPGHWAPAGWHDRYYRPGAPYYRPPYGGPVPPPFGGRPGRHRF